MLACTLTRICPSKLLLLVEERADALGAYFGVERSFNLVIKQEHYGLYSLFHVGIPT